MDFIRAGGFAMLLAAYLPPSAPARADQTAADQCAVGLTPIGKTMFNAALPKLLAGDTTRDALTSVARDMVLSGKVTRDEARSSAEAAASCLKVLK
jgi:hypothetical protein